ncbi:hypothetical protein CFIO01_09766 [Colletotrichum fioriniae PJ7]|uniref:Uncharacterized protein n=1 Tax=Colletotrichum fioriniae PJ7 TaxID=1445577 RepID=A0A010S631_9PEZI|nr:hypothetical protein CFIO01_09766 [Colletotrichum fioriniae PJ7]
MASRQSKVFGRLVDNQVVYSFIPHHPIKFGPGLHLSIQSYFPFQVDPTMRHVAFFGATGLLSPTLLSCKCSELIVSDVRCEESLLEMFDDADDFKSEYLDRITIVTADLAPESAAEVLFPDELRGEPVHTIVYGIGGFKT